MIKEKELMTYRVEFNEEQQGWHLEWHGKTRMQEPNTFGWHTIFEFINDDEFKIFKTMVDTQTLLKNKITLEDVLKCKDILVSFHRELQNRGFDIVRTHYLKA